MHSKRQSNVVGYTTGYKIVHLLQHNVSSQSLSFRHVLCLLIIAFYIKILKHKYKHLDIVPFLTMMTLPSIFLDTYLAFIFYLQQVFCILLFCLCDTQFHSMRLNILFPNISLMS